MISQRRKPTCLHVCTTWVFKKSLHSSQPNSTEYICQYLVLAISSLISLPPGLNKPQSLKKKLVKRAVRDVWSVMKNKRLLNDLPNIIAVYFYFFFSQGYLGAYMCLLLHKSSNENKAFLTRIVVPNSPDILQI